VEGKFRNFAGLPQAIINHGKRVYFYATSLSINADSHWFEPDLEPYLFAACMLHNLGVITPFDDKPDPYEISGAEVARLLLEGFEKLLPSVHVPPRAIYAVHRAISLHTQAAPAEPKTLTDHFRMAIMADADPSLVSHASARDILEAAYPRMGIESVLRRMIVVQALKNPKKAPEGSRARELINAGRAGHGFL